MVLWVDICVKVQTAGSTAGAVSAQLYIQTVSNASSATISSTNNTYLIKVTDSVSWLVTFTSSDPNVSKANVQMTSKKAKTCEEKITAILRYEKYTRAGRAPRT
ncbi:MAG: hypothetical protein C5B60_06825 [Chloroflexi bacterium]|nr:MAG: hypothetical protein C5B60_06825 [Chloroflexota bacterium]